MVFFTTELIETKLLIKLKVCSFKMNKGKINHQCIFMHLV